MGKGSEGPVPVVVMGLGAIGQALVRAAAASTEVELIGAVDAAPSLAGGKLGALVGLPGLRLGISASLGEALRGRKGAVVLQATRSRLPEVLPTLLEIIRAGCHVVSTCEELAFPWLHHPEAAEQIERAAEKAQVTVLGTGVNPGFVMDRLVATLGLACGPVRHARVERWVDVGRRREALQRRVGVGLTEAEFFQRLEADALGHVGLVESAALCAVGLGMDCDDFEEEVAPVFAEEDLPGAIPVPKGRVAGVSQTVIALEDGVERVRLELTLAVGIDAPVDRIVLDADPPVRMELAGGLEGDQATAHLVLNAAPRVTAADRGLLTVLELPAGR